MERPAYLRPTQYTQITEDIENMSVAAAIRIAEVCDYTLTEETSSALLIAILERPSKYLAFCGVLNDVEQLTGMFIEFDDGHLDDGHTYLIDAEAAVEIVAKEATILLRSGGEGSMVPLARIRQAFKNGCIIDYSERNEQSK